MFFNKIMAKLDALEVLQRAILEQQRAMVLAQKAANDAFADMIAETGAASPFQLDDAKMQEGISNLMGYDPFQRKRGDE